MGKLLIVKGADFSENALDKVVNPNNAVFQFGMEAASVFNTNMNASSRPTWLAPNDTLNANVVGKTITGFKIVSRGAGRTFDIAVFEYTEPSSTTEKSISELTPLYTESFTTTKDNGEIEEFMLSKFIKITSVNQRLSIGQNSAMKCHMGEYQDIVNYRNSGTGSTGFVYAKYNYMDKIFFDVKAVAE